MKPKIRKWKRNVLLCAGSALLLAALAFAAAYETRQLAAGEKATVTGAIQARDGGLIRILDKKSNGVVVVNINDDTKMSARNNTCRYGCRPFLGAEWKQRVSKS